MDRNLYYAELNGNEQSFFIYAENQVDAITQIFDKEVGNPNEILQLEIELVCEEHEIINLNK